MNKNHSCDSHVRKLVRDTAVSLIFRGVSLSLYIWTLNQVYTRCRYSHFSTSLSNSSQPVMCIVWIYLNILIYLALLVLWFFLKQKNCWYVHKQLHVYNRRVDPFYWFLSPKKIKLCLTMKYLVSVMFRFFILILHIRKLQYRVFNAFKLQKLNNFLT